MIIGLIFLIIILSFILIKSSEMVVVALRRISRETKTGVFALSAVILALGTSLPELFVGITSALEGSTNLSLGVVVGSNIANIALIAALTAFLTGRVLVHSENIFHETWIAFVAGTLPFFLVLDSSLSRVDALILIMVYLAYTTGFFRKRFEELGKEQQESENFFYRFFRKFEHVSVVKIREFGKLFVGIALLLASADGIVRLSEILAQEAGIPVFVVGLVILAVGTSLPELAFSLRSLKDHQPSMFFGNILGSVIINSTLIVGTSSLIKPVEINAFSQYATAVTTFLLVFGLFWFFVRSKHRLDRWEAGVLLLLYFIFIVVEFV